MILAVAIGQLAELVWVALVASVALAVTFALLILGAARWTELRRAGRGAAAAGYGALAVVAGVLFAGGVVAGVAVIASS